MNPTGIDAKHVLKSAEQIVLPNLIAECAI